MAIRAITFISSLFVITLGGPVFSPATLHWSNADSGDLYVNCNKVASLYSRTHYNSIKLDLNPGDVVALSLTYRRSKYGVIADLDIGNGMHCQTNLNQGPWKAVQASSSISKEWMCPGFDDAAWSYPGDSNVISSSSSVGSAKYSPYHSRYWLGAEYVWASGAGETTNVYLRLVVPSTCTVQKGI